MQRQLTLVARDGGIMLPDVLTRTGGPNSE